MPVNYPCGASGDNLPNVGDLLIEVNHDKGSVRRSRVTSVHRGGTMQIGDGQFNMIDCVCSVSIGPEDVLSIRIS